MSNVKPTAELIAWLREIAVSHQEALWDHDIENMYATADRLAALEAENAELKKEKTDISNAIKEGFAKANKMFDDFDKLTQAMQHMEADNG